MIFKGKWYDILKWFALTGIPTLAFLWINLAKIWGFPYAEAIGSTIELVALALGMLLGISSIKYQKALAKTTYEPETEADNG